MFETSDDPKKGVVLRGCHGVALLLSSQLCLGKNERYMGDKVPACVCSMLDLCTLLDCSGSSELVL